MKDYEESKKPSDAEDGGSINLPLGLCFGAAFGLLVQVITGNIIWFPIGVAAGFGLGTAIGSGGGKRKS